MEEVLKLKKRRIIFGHLRQQTYFFIWSASIRICH